MPSRRSGRGAAAGARQPAYRGGQGGPLRAGIEPVVCAYGRALRNGGDPGQGEAAWDKPVVEGSVRFVANQVAAVLQPWFVAWPSLTRRSSSRSARSTTGRSRNVKIPGTSCSFVMRSRC